MAEKMRTKRIFQQRCKPVLSEPESGLNKKPTGNQNNAVDDLKTAVMAIIAEKSEIGNKSPVDR